MSINYIEMKQTIITLILISGLAVSTYCSKETEHTYSLTVVVNNLRNSKGNVQFALYNKEGSIPDHDYKKYYLIITADIDSSTVSVTFNHLPQGKYAVNILHDENENGEIDKGFILPKEGVGFSNFQSISLVNRPNFLKASFDLASDKTVEITAIYM